MIISGTGHRPNKYPSYPGALIKLNNLIIEALASFVVRQPITAVIVGGAQGFDMSLGFAALSLKIPVITYGVTNQDKYYDVKGFYGKENYQELLDKSSKVRWFPEGKYLVRDDAMVDDATEILALYNPENYKSGTGYTVRYAQKSHKLVTNLWPLFIQRLFV